MIGLPDGARRVFAAGHEVSYQDAWRFVQAGISWLGWEEDAETGTAYLGTVTEIEPTGIQHRYLPMAIGFTGSSSPVAESVGIATLISEAGGYAPMLDVTATAREAAEAILALGLPTTETGGPSAAIARLWLEPLPLVRRHCHFLDRWDNVATVPLARMEIWRGA